MKKILKLIGLGKEKSTSVEAAGRNTDEVDYFTIKTIKSISAKRVKAVHKLDRAKNVESFVRRESEVQLIAALDEGEYSVIAIHGASKQGKTSVLRSVFSTERPHFIYQPGAKPTRSQFYRNVLASAKVGISAAETYRRSGEIDGKAVVIEARYREEMERLDELVTGEIEDPGYVGNALKAATNARVIVIDNFHHIDEEVQAELAADFVVLATLGFKIVIAGTWKETDYLTTRNTDLMGYYTSVSIDPWKEFELRAVVQAGADALNFQPARKLVESLAKAASGSVAALQLITRQWYLHHIEATDPRYNSGSYGHQVNAASNEVSKAWASEIATKLIAVTSWGAVDKSGRHQVSYIAEAILRSSPKEVAAGLSPDTLKAKVDQISTEWNNRAGRDAALMTKQDYMNKIKVGWMAHQVEKNNTPMFVYDRTSDLVTMNDSMLIFVHRTSHDKLWRTFEGLQKRS